LRLAEKKESKRRNVRVDQALVGEIDAETSVKAGSQGIPLITNRGRILDEAKC